MTTTTQPTFSFASSSNNVVTGSRGRKSGRNHRRTHSEDTDTGSLTYSATSSVQSGGSAAGESTDSSFADIMRVLDLQDSEQLKEFIKKEGCTSVDELQKKRGWSGTVGGGGVSVASSLAYSTDAESHLEGTKLLQTIVGQPSDSYGIDGGGVRDDKMDLLFAPAAPAIVKKTKGNKVVLGKDKTIKKSRSKSGNISKENNFMTTPKSRSSVHTRNTYEGVIRGAPDHRSQQRHDGYYDSSSSAASPSPSKSTPTRSPPGSTSSSGSCPSRTPPLPNRKRITSKDGVILDEEEDLWYKEWWMSCFPDAFKNLMPKR